VFVGNLPVKIKAKAVKKIFKEYGVVEAVRFRSLSLCTLEEANKDKAISREQVIKTRRLQKNEDSTINAYVVYATKEEAAAAVAGASGIEITGKVIRCDIAGGSAAKQHDHERSVFVGNLPHIVTEDEVRLFFEDCGDIESVRIPRDRLTSAGKGFGYVLFADRGSVSTALQKNAFKFKDRPLRVNRSTAKPEPTTKAVKRAKLAKKKGKGKGKGKDGADDEEKNPLDTADEGETSKFNNAGRSTVKVGRSSSSFHKQGGGKAGVALKPQQRADDGKKKRWRDADATDTNIKGKSKKKTADGKKKRHRNNEAGAGAAAAAGKAPGAKKKAQGGKGATIKVKAKAKV